MIISKVATLLLIEKKMRKFYPQRIIWRVGAGILICGLYLTNQLVAQDLQNKSDTIIAEIPLESSFHFELSAGTTVNESQGKWIPGLSLGAAAEYHKLGGVAARVSAVVFVDEGGRQDEIDEDRDPEWFEINIRAESFPWSIREDGLSKSELGWRFNTNYRDNTPTSVERNVTAVLGPRLRVKDRESRLDFQAGTHMTWDEIDDDLPRSRGADRSELDEGLIGPMVAALAEQELGGGSVCRETVQILANQFDSIFETRIGAAIDLPVDILVNTNSGGTLFLRLSGEHRWFDLDDRSSVLPFDQESNVRLEVIKSFGGRSDLNYGY